MAQMANCPQCNHEFFPAADANGSQRIDCPACGASFLLPHTSDPNAQSDFAAHAVNSPSSLSSSETPTRRIERRFQSADTVDDMPIRNIGYPLDAEFKSATANAPAPAPTQHARIDEGGATIEFDSQLMSDPSHNPDEELTLEAPLETTKPRATWEDSERIERLLADIESKTKDEYLPSSEAQGYSPDDETLADTSNYAPAPETSTHEPYDNSWSTDATPSDSLMSAAVLGGKPKHRSSIVRTLIGACIMGVVGLAAGDYALLWWYGPSGDLLKMAPYIPQAILPPSCRPAALVSNSTPPAPASDEQKKDSVAPASFEAPVAPAAGEKGTLVGDRYAVSPTAPTTADAQAPAEPARFADQSAAPLASTTVPAPQINGAPSYTGDQFNIALNAARKAVAGLVTGDLEDDAVRRTKGASYSMLADLAQIATFFDVAHDTPAAAESMHRDIDPLFRQALAEPRIRGEVARIVPVWIASPNRRHGGVFFAGQLASSVERGSLIEGRVNLGSGEPMTVLIPPALADRVAGSRQSLAIVGSLVDRPADRIPGYTGFASQAVWVSSLIPLDQ